MTTKRTHVPGSKRPTAPVPAEAARETSASRPVASPEERSLEAFRPIRQRKAADEVLTVIIDAIRGGLYQPGDRLPNHRDLAIQLEVSGGTVREAFSILDRAGVITVRRGFGGGAVVRSRVIPADVMVYAGGPNHNNLRAILEARRVLEMAAVEMATRRASEPDLQRLRELADLLTHSVNHADAFTNADCFAIDCQFHTAVAEASGNSVLRAYVSDTLRQYSLAREDLPVGHVAYDQAAALAQSTLAGISSGDVSEAIAAHDLHLAVAEEYFLGERLPQQRAFP